MEKAKIGENAGIIWRILESKGGLSFEELVTETGLDSTEILTAIGWLAREDKICYNKQNGVTSVRLFQEIYY